MAKKKPDIVKKDSIYDIDGRKGRLTVKLLADVDLSGDSFFDVEILEGVARYASYTNRIAQLAFGMGTPGDTITLRTTLNHFIRRRLDLEVHPPSGEKRR